MLDKEKIEGDESSEEELDVKTVGQENLKNLCFSYDFLTFEFALITVLFAWLASSSDGSCTTD